MRIMHIILIHDDEIVCDKCKKNKVLITPVDSDGYWRCFKCENKQRVAKISKKGLLKAIWRAKI